MHKYSLYCIHIEGILKILRKRPIRRRSCSHIGGIILKTFQAGTAQDGLLILFFIDHKGKTSHRTFNHTKADFFLTAWLTKTSICQIFT